MWGDFVTDYLQPKKTDLPVRAASAVVMVAVAGAAIWAGGAVFTGFLLLLGLGLLWEWWGLISKFAPKLLARLAWMVFGLVYIGWALKVVQFLLVHAHPNNAAPFLFIVTVLMVVVIDVGAYFSGRKFGGAKIAPSISPSKTWAGLWGGMAAAALFAVLVVVFEKGRYPAMPDSSAWQMGAMGIVFAIAVTLIAQSGDFFESWLKRRAGVKDSGKLIPGHGGLLDRLDGHLLVFALLPFVIFVVATFGDALFRLVR